MDFYLHVEKNILALHKCMQKAIPEIYHDHEIDGRLNCWMYMDLISSILGVDTTKDEPELTIENEKFSIKEYLSIAGNLVQFNFNSPNEHWLVIVNICEGYCALFEIDDKHDRFVKVMNIDGMDRYIRGIVDGQISDSFYHHTEKNRPFSAFYFKSKYPFSVKTINNYMKKYS